MRVPVPLAIACAAALHAPADAQCPATDPPAPCWVDFDTFDHDSAFLDASLPAFDDYEKDMVVIDVDLDHDDDVVIVRKNPLYAPGGDVTLLFLNQGGKLVDASGMVASSVDDTLLAPRDVVVLDANGDLYPDFVVGYTFDQVPRLWLNLGESGGQWQGFADVPGAFQAAPTCMAPVGCNNAANCSVPVRSCALGAADMDGDGYDDVYLSTYGDPDVAQVSSTGDRVFLNDADGTGTFTDVTWTALPGCISLNTAGGMTTAAVSDFDGDDAPDILRGGPFTAFEIFWNDDNGAGVSPTFSTRTQINGGVYMGGVADLNGDGDPDVYYGADGTDRVRLNPGGADAHVLQEWVDETYQMNDPAYHAKTFCTAGNMGFADIDGDGAVDVAVADIDIAEPTTVNQADPYFALYRNHDHLGGAFGLEDPDSNEALTINFQDTSVYDLVFIDLDGDGTPGILAGTSDGYRYLQRKPFGENYGTAQVVPHSGGTIAVIDFAGRPSISENAFQLRATGAPPNVVGHFLYSFSQTSVPFYDGTLLAGPQVQRLPNIVSDANGTFVFDIDFDQAPFASGPAQVAPCDVVYFQLFYRDPSPMSPTGGNLSDGLQITLWD